MNLIQKDIHDIGQTVKMQWNTYFEDKKMHEILYDIVGAVASYASVISFFANPVSTLFSIAICASSTYFLHKNTYFSDKPVLKLALTLIAVPILATLTTHLLRFPVIYFKAVLIHSATLWAASKCPMPQEEVLTQPAES